MEPDERRNLTPQQQAMQQQLSMGQLTPQQQALLSPQQQAQLQLQVPGMQAVVVMMPSGQQQPGQFDQAQHQQQYGQQQQQQQQQLQQQQQQQELSVLMQRAEGQGVPCNECHAECSHSMSIV
jgi:hypothetical protein